MRISDWSSDVCSSDLLVEGGADVIELGMPFTDPMADGPAIQAATLRSLAAGTTTAGILAIARDFRARHPHIPPVLIGYSNPLLPPGPDWFDPPPRTAWISSVLLSDSPPQEDLPPRPP